MIESSCLLEKCMPPHLPLPGLDLGKSAFLKNDTRSLFFFDQPASPGWFRWPRGVKGRPQRRSQPGTRQAIVQKSWAVGNARRLGTGSGAGLRPGRDCGTGSGGGPGGEAKTTRVWTTWRCSMDCKMEKRRCRTSGDRRDNPSRSCPSEAPGRTRTDGMGEGAKVPYPDQ